MSALPVSWPAGVRIKLRREGYSREPQDVVQRHKPDAGPARRYLLDGACSERVQGALSLPPSEADLFRAWLEGTAEKGMRSFDWQITDTGAPVIARFSAQPKFTRTASRWLVAVDIATQPPEPTLGALGALAAFEDAGPADWPLTVPFRPKRSGWALTPEDGVLRSPEEGLQRQSLSSRADGSVLDLVIHASNAQKAAFEGWFRTQAAFGARDVRFPGIGGGTHLGHFHRGYTITPARTAEWAITTAIYLEVVP